jgi:hypothetical protein
MLDPDDADSLPPRLLDEVADMGDDCVAFVSSLDHAVLHVDDKKRGVRPVLKSGLVCPSPSLDFAPVNGRPAPTPGGYPKWS